MLKKTERLSRPAFMAYFKLGKRHHHDWYTVIYIKSPRFLAAVVVSKKVSKQAVKRNLIRRRLYGALAAAKAQGTTGIFIILTKPAISQVNSTTLFQTTTNLIGQIGKPA